MAASPTVTRGTAASRCLLCHGEKLLGAGLRRGREKRLWRVDWGV
jgi:hypothetical protein